MHQAFTRCFVMVQKCSELMFSHVLGPPDAQTLYFKRVRRPANGNDFFLTCFFVAFGPWAGTFKEGTRTFIPDTVYLIPDTVYLLLDTWP